MSVPDRIGRFVVSGQAGGGGFATVYRAQDEALQSAVAIKVLAANWAHDAAMHQRFLAEARLLRRADSDRVVRVHDIGELPDGRPYLVMTFADRGTLHERLRAGALPWPAAVAIAVEIALGLRVLHEAGVLHRDIKPSNVLFRSQPGGREQLLLGDLGLGRLLTEAAVPTLVAGTPGYMAPEQGIVGAPVSVRTDVYAVGAVLFRALTGRGPGEADVVTYPGPHCTVPPARLTPGLPAALDQLVLRCMARDPQHRYPDIHTLLGELHQAGQFAHGGGRPPPPPAVGPARPTATTQPGSGRRRRRWLVSGVAAGSVVLAAAGAVAIYEPGRRTVEVSSQAPGVRLTVPRDWARQVAARGWDPALLGLEGGTQPAVLVAGSAEAYARTSDSRPGAFAGTLPDGAEPAPEDFLASVRREDCTEQDGGAVPVGDEVLASLRQRCDRVVLDDVLLRQDDRLAWVQVKQPASVELVTHEVVASVRLE